MLPARPLFLDRADRVIDLVASAFSVIGSIAVFSLMLTTIIAVVWRYLLNDPIFGIEDVSILTLSIIAAAAVAFGARKDAHVSIDLISKYSNRHVLRAVDVVMKLLVIGMTGFVTYSLVRQACGIERACLTENLSVEHRMFYYIMASSMALYFVHSVFDLVSSFYLRQHDTVEKETE